MRAPYAALVALLCACSGGASGSGSAPGPAAEPPPEAPQAAQASAPEPPEPAPGQPAFFEVIPGYPGARELCYQHVTGDRMHILWTGHASADPIERVRAFYERHRGPATLIDAGADSFTLELPAERSVSIHRMGAPRPDCGVAPADTDRTYFVASASTE